MRDLVEGLAGAGSVRSMRPEPHHMEVGVLGGGEPDPRSTVVQELDAVPLQGPSQWLDGVRGVVVIAQDGEHGQVVLEQG